MGAAKTVPVKRRTDSAQIASLVVLDIVKTCLLALSILGRRYQRVGQPKQQATSLELLLERLILCLPLPRLVTTSPSHSESTSMHGRHVHETEMLINSLPPFSSSTEPNFVWGDSVGGETFGCTLTGIYECIGKGIFPLERLEPHLCMNFPACMHVPCLC